MPQVLFLAAIGAGLYAGFRALTRAGEQFAADLKRGDEAARQQARARDDGPQGAGKNLGTLEFDPASGVYKPTHRS